MKASVTADFLVFIGGLVILVIIMATAFGKGIIANFLSYVAVMSPEFLSEDLSTFLTISAYMPGDVTTIVSVQQPRRFDLIGGFSPEISVTDISKVGNTPITTPFTIDLRYINVIAKTVDADVQNNAIISKTGNNLTIGGSK